MHPMLLLILTPAVRGIKPRAVAVIKTASPRNPENFNVNSRRSTMTPRDSIL